MKSHNSVEQKLVVRTPSGATNVSDHSSMNELAGFFISVLGGLDFFCESELFLLLSCAFAPTFKRTLFTMRNHSRLVKFLLLGLIESISSTEEVDQVEFLLLQCSKSFPCDVQQFKSLEQNVSSA